MFVYSSTISSFLARIKSEAHQIMRHEMGLQVYRERFEYKNRYIPLHFVIFERQNVWGFYDAQMYQIGLHRQLLFENDQEKIKNILRHELAHMMTSLDFPKQHHPHGPEFRQTCRSFGWGPEVYAATMQKEEESSQTQDSKIFSKIKKLLALASSQNGHEAAIATAKANELLLKHNLELAQIDEQDQDVYLKRVLTQKRNNAKLHAIYEILQTFLVSPVFSHGKNIIHLEVVGQKENVELADYVAKFLDHELERLWRLNQKEKPQLKGAVAKNSFLKGLAKGYCEKIRHSQQNIKQEQEKAMIKVQHQLAQSLELVYPRLGHGRSSSKFCHESSQMGKQAGARLSIRPGVSQESQKRLTYST